MTVTIAALIKAAEGKGDLLEQELRKLVPQVRKDPGVLAYVAHRGIADPLQFFVYEKYESEEALKYHGSTPHFKKFREAIATLVEGRMSGGRFHEFA